MERNFRRAGDARIPGLNFFRPHSISRVTSTANLNWFGWRDGSVRHAIISNFDANRILWDLYNSTWKITTDADLAPTIDLVLDIFDLDSIRFMLAEFQDDLTGVVARFHYRADLEKQIGQNGTMLFRGAPTDMPVPAGITMEISLHS